MNRLQFFAGIIIVLLVTLQSFYFYQLRLAPFPLIAFLLTVVISDKKSLDRTVVGLGGLFFVLFLVSSVIGLLFTLEFFYLNSVFGMLLGPVFLIFATSVVRDWGYLNFSSILKWVLIIHIFFFLVQFIGYYLLRLNIDYLVIFTGEESRFEGFGTITGLIRATGLFNEPATYSYYIFFLVYARYLCTRKLVKLDHFALFTMLLSLSISGMLLFAFMQIFYWIMVRKNLVSVFILSGLITIGIIVAIYFFQDTVIVYFIDRLTNINDDNSANIRFSGGFQYFFSLPWIYILFGLGIGNYAQEATATSGYMAIITTFGLINSLIFTGLISFYFYSIRIKFKDLFPFFILLMSTIIPNLIIFWFILATLFISRERYTRS